LSLSFGARRVDGQGRRKDGLLGAMESSTGPAEGPDPAGLSYEDARAELIAVVQALESGTETLAESLSLWERGEALANRCQEWLDQARQRLDQRKAEVTGASQGDDTGDPTQ